MKKVNQNEIKYPAPFLAHWVTGPVACCKEHCNALVGLGSFMGAHVAVTTNEDESLECENCKNEGPDNKQL